MVLYGDHLLIHGATIIRHSGDTTTGDITISTEAAYMAAAGEVVTLVAVFIPAEQHLLITRPGHPEDPAMVTAADRVMLTFLQDHQGDKVQLAAQATDVHQEAM